MQGLEILSYVVQVFGSAAVLDEPRLAPRRSPGQAVLADDGRIFDAERQCASDAMSAA
jgi:hypothetical protein